MDEGRWSGLWGHGDKDEDPGSPVVRDVEAVSTAQ